MVKSGRGYTQSFLFLLQISYFKSMLDIAQFESFILKLEKLRERQLTYLRLNRKLFLDLVSELSSPDLFSAVSLLSE